MITKEKIPWSVIKFSQLILKGNVWRSVWRICMLILGLKRVNYCICDFPCHCHSLNPSPCRSVADPRGPPPRPLFLDQTEARRAKKNFWDLAPLYIKAWICHCHLLPFLLCYSVYYKVSLLLTSVPLFLIPKKKNHKALYTKNLESGGHSIVSTSPSMDEIF